MSQQDQRYHGNKVVTGGSHVQDSSFPQRLLLSCYWCFLTTPTLSPPVKKCKFSTIASWLIVFHVIPSISGVCSEQIHTQYSFVASDFLSSPSKTTMQLSIY